MDNKRLKQAITHLHDAKQQYKEYEHAVLKDMHIYINDKRLEKFIHNFIHMHSTLQAIDKYSDVILEYIEKDIVI